MESERSPGVRPSPSVIALVPEVTGEFLWDRSPGAAIMSPIEPSSLGLSSQLIKRLAAWYRSWEERSQAYIYDDVPQDEKAEEVVDQEGAALAAAIKRELHGMGSDVSVIYAGREAS